MTLETLALVAAVAFTAGYIVCEAQLPHEETDDVERFLAEQHAALEERYTEDSAMDYVEFGDRVAILQAPGTESIMRDAVAVDGVGLETAFKIAKEFDGDYERYREASQDELERVNGVGENRARALRA